MKPDKATSEKIRRSGLPEAAFGHALKAPLGEYEFAVARDLHGRLWLEAHRGGGVQLSMLHEPPQPTGGAEGVLTADQWMLAVEVAVSDDEVEASS